MIKAHGDGSRTGGIAAVVMCAAEAATWDAIEAPWERAASDLGVHPFHMSDFIAHEKRPARREAVLGRLLGVVNPLVPMCSAVVLNEADFALMPHVLAVRLGGNHYFTCATASLAMVHSWSARNGHADPIVGVFERGDDGQDSFHRAIVQLIAAPDSFRREMGLEEIIIAPKGRAGLAMADMLAWAMTHYVPEMKLLDPVAEFVLRALNPELYLDRRYLRKSKLVELAHDKESVNKLRALDRRHGVNRAAQFQQQLPPPPKAVRKQRKRGLK